jgi:hypothetical protein
VYIENDDDLEQLYSINKSRAEIFSSGLISNTESALSIEPSTVITKKMTFRARATAGFEYHGIKNEKME